MGYGDQVNTDQAFREIATTITGGTREDVCEFDHSYHERLTLDVCLPNGRRRPFTIFNWFRYETPAPGYCEGRDEVSKGIQHAGGWEQGASEVVWEILKRPGPGVVLDVGSHVGWYATLATEAGRSALAVDASREHLELVDLNAPTALTVLAWIDAQTPTVPDVYLLIRLLKIDIEGNEAEALRAFRPLLDRTEAILMEVTPPNLAPAEMLMRLGFTDVRAVDRPNGPNVNEFAVGQENYLFERLGKRS